MKNDEFMDEYLNRLAQSLAQFWPAGETVPVDNQDDEVYYRVAIKRLAVHRRVELVDRLIGLGYKSANFFTPETPMHERAVLINGVIDRFEDLREARHQRLVGYTI